MTRTASWAAVLAVLALVLAVLPLTALLGYESAFVIGAVAAFASAHLGAEGAWRWRTEASAADREAADARPVRELARLVARRWRRSLTLLIVPVALLAANALRVKNCNLAAGFEWTALLPVVSTLTGTVAGVIAGLVTRRRLSGTLVAFGVVLGSLAWGVWRFYAAPPVFAYDPFAGYFPGSLYDEEVGIDGTLVLARALHVMFAAAAVLVVAPLLDGRALRLRAGAARGRVRTITLAVVAAALAIGGVRAEPRLGIAPDVASIGRELSATLRSPHFVLRYAPAGPWSRDIALTADDAEFRYAQLARFFGVEPHAAITCFLFANAEEKRRAMGASHTQVAKPWRHEIYLQQDAWPHPVLQHELAHVFAGEFGDPVFHVARRGLRFNVGLIEGAAVAADRRAQAVTLDQAVKVMRLLGIEPPIARVFGPGFLAYASAQAYTVAGSFCRFLVERYGAASFRALYRSGGDFAGTYGKRLDALAAEWSARIDATSVDEVAREVAAERLRRPGVLRKVCAHELALREEEARRRAAAGQNGRALALLSSLCQDDPDDPERLASLVDATLAADDPEGAAHAARRLLAHPKASASQRAHAHSVLGDIALRAGRDADAATEYRRALTFPLPEASSRQIRARLIAATDERVGPTLGRYLVGDGADRTRRDPAIDLHRARAIVDAAPDRAIGYYLFGRQLASHDEHRAAVAALEQALAIGLHDPGFTAEARRVLALSALRVGDRERARATLRSIAADPASTAAARSEAADMLERCDAPTVASTTALDDVE